MNYREDLTKFCENHQYQKINVENAEFRYLLCGSGSQTLVFLVGGTGVSEMYMNYITALEKDYRILTFDYPMEYTSLKELCEGISLLLTKLSIPKAIFVGSSLGGYVAQIFAAAHHEQTEGMCLFSTAGLDEQTITNLKKSHKYVGVMFALMKIIPYNWLKPFLIKVSMKHVSDASNEEYRYLDDMFRFIFQDYTKEFDMHMTKLMIDISNQHPYTEKDFRYLDGRVLLIFPEKDASFTPEMQNDLKKIMTNPVVIDNVKGGHVATMIKVKQYVDAIRSFVKE